MSPIEVVDLKAREVAQKAESDVAHLAEILGRQQTAIDRHQDECGKLSTRMIDEMSDMRAETAKNRAKNYERLDEIKTDFKDHASKVDTALAVLIATKGSAATEAQHATEKAELTAYKRRAKIVWTVLGAVIAGLIIHSVTT